VLLPSRFPHYRQPTLTFADAYLIADRALEELQAKHFPDYAFTLRGNREIL